MSKSVDFCKNQQLLYKNNRRWRYLCCTPDSLVLFAGKKKNLYMALTKSVTGTWDLGTGDSRTWDAGTQGHDKQTTPEFCAEFVKDNFRCS